MDHQLALLNTWKPSEAAAQKQDSSGLWEDEVEEDVNDRLNSYIV